VSEARPVVRVRAEILPAWYSGIVRRALLAAVWLGFLPPERALKCYKTFLLRTARLRVHPINVQTNLGGGLDDYAPAEPGCHD